MRHFIFEDKDYEINPKYKVPKKDYVLMAGLAALYYFSKSGFGKRGGKGSGSYNRTRRNSIDRRQNCIAKMYYSYSMDAHKEQLDRYLKREGAGKDGQTPELFGCDEKEYRDNMDAKNFRIILSPANDTVPLNVLARTFITQLELQTGYEFYWVGAEHHNTAHPHVHLLINGKDKKGQDVYLDPDLVKTHMRDIARDLCTSLVGERTDEQIRKEKLTQVNASRFIMLDNEIAGMSFDNTLDTRSLFTNRELLLSRLSHLSKMGLCTYNEKKYVFEHNWQETLRNQGRYNVYLGAREKLRYTSKYDFKLFTSEDKIKRGIITRVYRMQEDSDANAAVMEGIDGKAYFIPLYKKASVRYGDMVSVEALPNQKGRLTPVFNKITQEELKRHCDINGYTKGFAKNIRTGSFERKTEREL